MNDIGPAAVAGLRSSQLIEYLAQLTLDRLDASVVHDAVIGLVDGLGCGLYGAQMPRGTITADFAYAEKSRGKSTVFGRPEPVAPARAALCDGTAMHGIELDDIAEGSQVHPGSVVIPAALAAAEHCNASGERLLLGIVAGYEAMARVGRAIGEASWGFHITGVAGPIGAAAAAGVSMNLPSEKILRAVGIKSFTRGSGGMIKRSMAAHLMTRWCVIWHVESNCILIRKWMRCTRVMPPRLKCISRAAASWRRGCAVPMVRPPIHATKVRSGRNSGVWPHRHSGTMLTSPSLMSSGVSNSCLPLHRCRGCCAGPHKFQIY